MSIRTLRILLCAITLTVSAIANAADVGATDQTTYLLLDVKSDGPMTARDIVFTNVDTGEEVWIRNLHNLSRLNARKFIIEEIPAGFYYLSKIYPMLNRNEAASAIEYEESAGVIGISPGLINYIGDVIIKSKEVGRGITSMFTYEPNSKTLLAAASNERELFESRHTVVTIAGNDPVPVDPRLLGL